MQKQIIKIDESRCTGCGNCATACAGGAIKIVNGKAKLVAAEYCDGLGNCIGHCPHGALTIGDCEILANKQSEIESPCQCPSMQYYQLTDNNTLPNWPIQLALIPATASFLKNKELIIAADCTAFASPQIRAIFSPQTAMLIGCPKLDTTHNYIEKLTHIFQNANPQKVTVLRMEVPCCSMLTKMVQTALTLAQKTNIEFTEQIVSIP